jgi:small neutral amino acid transporter SnatA (MarC family)
MPTDALAAVVIDPQRVFVILFLMLGPVKLLVPFVEMSRQSDPAFRRVLANRAIMFSAAALLLAGAIGDKMVANFGIPLPVLALAGGLILFLVALNTILEQFAAPSLLKPEGAPRDLHALTARLAFPTIVTPSGVAAIIVFCALAKNDVGMLSAIGGITLGILLLDWLAMLFAESILRWGRVALQLFAVILGVIQVSLGLQLMLRGLSLSGVLPISAG